MTDTATETEGSHTVSVQD